MRLRPSNLCSPPCAVGAGASAYCLGAHATADDGDTVHRMLSSVGFCLEVQEKELDAVTGEFFWGGGGGGVQRPMAGPSR